jgi:hypothetical protein
LPRHLLATLDRLPLADLLRRTSPLPRNCNWLQGLLEDALRMAFALADGGQRFRLLVSA